MRTFVKYLLLPALVIGFLSIGWTNTRFDVVLAIGIIALFAAGWVYVRQDPLESGGYHFDRGRYGKARREFERGVREKSIEAAGRLGDMHFLGLGEPADTAAGLEAYRAAMDLIDEYSVSIDVLKPGATGPAEVDPNYSPQLHIAFMRTMLSRLQRDGIDGEAALVLRARLRDGLARSEGLRY
ncbi:MAG: hypothetical protein LUC93_12190 [Planctomycetaceae bacterium]|nr:hypothetical protein [Planctomycetaceae bacterium]